MIRIIRITVASVAYIVLGAFAVGCGGGGGASVSAIPAAGGTNDGKTIARLVITIPLKSPGAASGSRTPAFVSPSTQSIAVQIDSSAPVSQNLTPGSPNCSVPGALSALTCIVNIGAVPGSHTFTFTTYDQVGSVGNKLSINSVVQTLYWDQVNPVNVTLAGVPKQVLVAPLPSATGISGNATSGLQFLFDSSRSISVAAVDSDGNYIVGPGAPALSVTITGATPAANMGVSAATDGNPNHYVLNATSTGTGTLSVTATPNSSLAGSAIVASVALTSEVLVTNVLPFTSGGFADGPSATALIGANARGITFDSADGNLYISDTNNCTIRQMTITGTITSYAGSAPPVYNKCNALDGIGSTTSGAPGFYFPEGITYDPATQSFYVADYGNCEIRQVSGVGAVVSTLAGSSLTCGNADGQGSAAKFFGAMDIAYDANNGNLYVVDIFNCNVRQVSPLGATTTIAGGSSCASSSGFVDGTGSAARFSGPWGITYDSTDHNLYVADTGNCAIRKVTPGGVVTTLAGSLASGGSSNCVDIDGTGSAAQFGTPYGITYDSGDGNLYVGELNQTSSTGSIRQVTPAGVVSTLVGGGSGAHFYGLPAYLRAPLSLTVDPVNGYLYVLDGNLLRQVQL